MLAAAQGGIHADGRGTWGQLDHRGPWGEVVAGFDHDEPGVLVADIDPDGRRQGAPADPGAAATPAASPDPRAHDPLRPQPASATHEFEAWFGLVGRL